MNLATAVFQGRETDDVSCVRIGAADSAVVGGQEQKHRETHKQHLSYRDAVQAVDAHRAWLQQRLCLSKEVVVAYISANSVDYFLSVLACTTTMMDSVTPALLNTRWTAPEMAQALQLGSSNCIMLLYGQGYSKVAHHTRTLLLSSKACADIQCLELPAIGRRLCSVERRNTVGVVRPTTTHRIATSDRHPSDAVAVVCFTSGTTNGSKGVQLSHRALIVQAQAKRNTPCTYSSTTNLLATTVPFCHVGGLSSILAVWMAGGTLTLPDTSHTAVSSFDPKTVGTSITALHVNTLVVVPAMLHAMKQHHCRRGGDGMHAPHVRLILVGGQSASVDDLNFCRQSFPNARIVQTFACTEAASSLTFLDVSAATAAATTTTTTTVAATAHLGGECVGTPPDHIHIEIADSAFRIILKPRRIGLIVTQGPHMMNGYWNGICQPRGKWWISSDLGWKDKDGRLYFVGRATDSIRTGGETVMAAEIERVLLQHTNVMECAVFGVPHPRFGETVCCAMVVRSGDLQEVKAVRQWCQEHGIAGYKQPRLVFHLNELPRNSSGKVLKYKLKQRFSGGTSKL